MADPLRGLAGDMGDPADRSALMALIRGLDAGLFPVVNDTGLPPSGFRVTPHGTVYLGTDAYDSLCAAAAADGVDIAERGRLWDARN